MSTDVNVKIGADISQFQTAMARVKQSTNDTMKSVLEKWANISTGIRNSTRIIQESLSTLSVPMQEFAKWEDTATRLAPLVGGLSTAKELASALRDEAATGTMSFEQLASVAGRLATVFKSSEAVRKWTTAFHDLAAGTGMDINELVGNFVRSRASGRFEAGLMDMFAQKGVNIFPELVKQTGKSEVALRKLAAEGKLSFSEVEQAILSVATGTGRFAGQATAMSNTFGGSVGTMVAQWRTLLAEMTKPIAESLTPVIQGIGNFLKILKEHSAAFSAVATAIGVAAAAVSIYKLAIAGLTVVMAVNPIFATASAITSAIAALTVGYTVLRAGTDAQTEAMLRQRDAAEELRTAIGSLVDDMDTTDRTVLEAVVKAKRKDAQKRRESYEKDTYESLYPENTPQDKERFSASMRYYDSLFSEGKTKHIPETLLAILQYEQAIEKQYRSQLALVEELERERKAESAVQAAKDEREAIEGKIEALEKYREQLLKTRQAEALSGIDARERPAAILANAGFGDEQQLAALLAWKEADLKFAGNAEQAQKTVDELKDLYATQEKLNKAKAEADKRQAQADAAANAARQRIALLKAEISGNRELAKQMQERERHERIMQELTDKGVNADEAARIATRTVAMENLQAAGTAGRELIGNGLVTSSQASIGGGRSIQVGGESAAVSIARSQLTVMEKIKAAIDAVEKNTAGGFKPALV